jgi:small subunit ribosomal protein S16
MLTIRMRREGGKKRSFFRLVVTEGRTPRDGKFLESLGTYDPRTKPETVRVDRERLAYWLKSGARPSDTVRTVVARHKLEPQAESRPVEAAPAQASS